MIFLTASFNMQAFSFIKMHGLGNDFVVIDGRDTAFTFSESEVKHISDRHFGVGCDQFIIIAKPSQEACDCDMIIYNTDGSRAESCGNATRCVARLIIEEKGEQQCTINTLGGILHCTQNAQDIAVNMGLISCTPSNIPLNASYNSHVIHIHPHHKNIYCASVGNPHAVILLTADDRDDDAYISEVGAYIETHEAFPNKTNVEFVRKIDETNYKVRVWERGVGITLACGSGATAVYGILRLLHPNIEHATLHMDGGQLYMYHNDANHIFMQGPTQKAFTGFWVQ